jgi:hypothetical protein
LKRLKDFSHRKGSSFHTRGCVIACVLLFLSGCAGIERRLSERPFDPEAVAALKADLTDQRNKVQSFFSVGRLQVKAWQGQDLEAAIFSAWTPSPLRIKIEVTHPWGQPILHLLVDGEELHFLSFSERKLYAGPFTTRSLSKFLPGEMDPSLIQDLLRAYPGFDPEHRAHSNEPNQISFYGPEGGELRVIKFDRESRRPTELMLPHQNIRLVFSDFEAAGGLCFARETALVHVLGGKRLVHKIETVIFNRTIPDQVFSLEAPPGFEVVPLE